MIVEQKKISKPWGHEIIWPHCNKFVGKILCINKGERLSRQYHIKKEETILPINSINYIDDTIGVHQVENKTDKNVISLHVYLF